MNKKLFFLAIAALGLAACSNDDVVEINQSLDDSNSINFRPLINNVTRGADINQAWVQENGFTVRATVNGTGAQYMPENHYTYSAGTYTSTDKYYWPSGQTLDFFAWAASGSDVAHTANTYVFTVTPNATASAQSDLVVACGKEKTKELNGVSGVPLNFRHAESKVTITLTNSNASALDFIVRDASICNVKNSGVFTFANTASGPTTATDGRTTTSEGTFLNRSQWADVAEPATTTTSYTQAITTLTTLSNDWILIPQALTYSTQYNDEDANDAFTAPCIKISLKIQNHSNSAYIVGAASGDNDGYVTAMWPISAPDGGWMPGRKYTYSVDLAGGGYFDKNNTGDMGLDPILVGAEIKFVTVTVDAWVDYDTNAETEGNQPINVGM